MKIRLIRFMSSFELSCYLKGEKLENHTDWSRKRGVGASRSMGFCFFPEAGNDPEKLLQILTGIVELDKVVVFETEASNVHKSQGRYRDPDTDIISLDTLLKDALKPVQCQLKDEYYTEDYDQSRFQLLKIGDVIDPFYDRRILWQWWAGLPVRPEGVLENGCR